MVNRKSLVLFFIGLISSTILFTPSLLADWPMYRHDYERSGVTEEKIETPLYLQWVYIPKNPPQPAWPEPGKEINCLDFDYAYQVSVSRGVVYFGSSADNKVYALDLNTGKERWSFFTDAPVRFSPTVWNGRVLVVSDDGWLYCLSVVDGKLLWKFRGGPRDEILLGNERMISRWPMRTGVIVKDNIVYTTAGMWPSEGIYVYALSAEDGKVIWKNDTSGCMYMKQPHGGEALTGVAPQGYILASPEILFVPTGRNLPAAFDRKTGRFLYYWAGKENVHRFHGGGARAMVSEGIIFCEGHPWLIDQDASESEAQPTDVAGMVLYDFDRRSKKLVIEDGVTDVISDGTPSSNDGMILYDVTTGSKKLEIKGKPLGVIREGTLYATGSGNVSAIGLKELLASKELGKCTKWKVKHGRTYSLIMAGDTLFVGGDGIITAISSEGNLLWTGTVDEQVRGLAVSDGRLLVSLSSGNIACFAAKNVSEPTVIKEKFDSSPYPKNKLMVTYASEAERTIKQTGVEEGYCLVFGADDDGRLLYELAKRTELEIYSVEPDAKKLSSARKALDSACLYGVRVTVHHTGLKKLPYASYFANLIVVSGEGFQKALKNAEASELYRMLRPCGGVAYIDTADGDRAGNIRTWLSRASLPKSEIHEGKSFIKVIRNPLPGAGKWTHQYANVGRTGCSSDQIVKWPMKLLWFGGPGPGRMMDRHWRTSPPVSINGRLFVTGQHCVLSLDAYNGRELWCRKFQNVGIWAAHSRGSNIATDEDSIYLGYGERCYRIDAQTGKDRDVYKIPIEIGEKKKRWQYVAVWKELLFGTLAVISGKPEGAKDVAKYLFAIGKEDGTIRWTYKAENGVYGHSIAIGDRRLFLLDRPSKAQIDRHGRRGEEMPKKKLIALDARSGKLIWSKDLASVREIPDPRKKHFTDGRMVSFAKGIVLVGGMTAFSAKDGDLLWQSKIYPETIPIIVGKKIITQPYAYDLQTGDQLTRIDPLTDKKVPWEFRRYNGCGMNSASQAEIFFRASTLGIYDLVSDAGIANFGGIRPGCFINAIPANGLLLLPEASSGCTCSYNYQTSLALTPTKRSNENWFVFSSPKTEGRVKHAFINLGAPGDRRDNEGKMWFAFPRPDGEYKLPLSIEKFTGFSYYRRNANSLKISGTDCPWVYASGCCGLWQVKISLFIGAAEVFQKLYTVRLHFAELDNVKKGQRVFDVMIQDKVAEKEFDIVKETGKNTALVKEFNGIKATDSLIINFIPSEEKPKALTAPILSGIEVIAEDTDN